MKITWTRLMTSAAITATFALSVAGPVSASDEAHGRELANSLGCKGCHKIEGSGGTMGPALDGVGQRMDEKKIRQKLVNPKEVNPGSMMPSYEHLSDEDLEALIEYLEDL